MIGAKIGKHHTYRDWGLYMAGIDISAPEVNTRYISVPGRNGALDISEALTGFPTFKNRSITLTFDTQSWNFDSWERKYSEVLNACHGQRLTIQLDTDPAFAYEGRISVSSKKEVLQTDELTISATVAPYKLELNSSLEPWLWDSFSFETGIVREYGDMAVNGSLVLTIPGRSLRVVPVIIASDSMTVTYQGVTYPLKAGENQISEICLPEGESTLTFTGNGTVSVEYRGGEL